MDNKVKTQIQKLIKTYAIVYKEFEEFQKREKKEKQEKQGKQGVLPIGDQKTGVIGEYYAKCFIENLPNICEVDYAEPGSLFDIRYKHLDSSEDIRVQVKCVSAHSITKVIAPLNMQIKDGKRPFDKLFLIALDIDFIPIGFFINTYEEIAMKFKDCNKENTLKISGAKLKFQEKEDSKYFNFQNNLYEELKSTI